MVCTKFNITCWGHFLSHGSSQNPGVFAARKSEAALACSSHCHSLGGPHILPALRASPAPSPWPFPSTPVWVPTSQDCFRVGGTGFPTSKETLIPSAFCTWELLSFLLSFQNTSFHSFLPLPNANCLLRNPPTPGR